MSKKERRRTRISSTIDKLPDDIKTELDVRLADTANTYEELSAWLKAEGYEISKSAIGRYAIRSTQAAQRVAETLQRTQADRPGGRGAPRPRLHESGVDGSHGRPHAAREHGGGRLPGDAA
ncbi:phage protein Gp27 family protein [Agathobaculum sp. NTUH-O15-33]|uniref:phage protein Gp27 family protein n=1 Tax=Agathobaculum sp. NTUH-O15-33 TaxID=3079302 RepID=UPI003FA476D7